MIERGCKSMCRDNYCRFTCEFHKFNNEFVHLLYGNRQNQAFLTFKSHKFDIQSMISQPKHIICDNLIILL
jgi:hypothetical protein